MDVLLDECIDQRLARELPGHNIRSVPQMGWSGIKNGRLMALAEQEFDVFLTVDRNLSFQQNLPQFNIALIVLHAPSNRLVDLKPLAPAILAMLPKTQIGQAMIVTIIPQTDDE